MLLVAVKIHNITTRGNQTSPLPHFPVTMNLHFRTLDYRIMIIRMDHTADHLITMGVDLCSSNSRISKDRNGHGIKIHLKYLRHVPVNMRIYSRIIHGSREGL
jgi:hypothetical protein